MGRSRPPLTLWAHVVGLVVALGCDVLAQTPTFTDETSSRLTAGVASDTSEKDFGIADFDQDGDADVVIARRVGLNGNNGSPLPNTLLLNLDGVLTDVTTDLAPDLLDSQRSRDVVVDDFDADGWIDILIINGPSTAPQLLLNAGASGTGTGGASDWLGFTDQSSFLPVGFTIDGWSGASGDLVSDGDEYPDLFLGVRIGDDRLLVNLGVSVTGWLGFSDESTRLGTNANTNGVRSVTIHDLNDDGDQDIIEGVTGTGVLRMLPNDGSGQFTGAPQNFASSATYNHALGDLDDDGLLDIFAVQNGIDQYRTNDGPGVGETITLGPLVSAPGTSGFGSICRVADLDANGFDDFLVCDLDQEFPQDCTRRLQFLYNQGSAPYLSNGYPAPVAWAPNGTSDVAIIDVDGDSDLDLLIGHCVGNSVFTQDGSGVVPELFVRGDVNDDGALDVADPVALLDYLFGASGATLGCDDAADGNDDGGVDVADAVSVLDWLFGGTGGFLPEPSSCGEDPTDDGLACSTYTNCP